LSNGRLAGFFKSEAAECGNEGFSQDDADVRSPHKRASLACRVSLSCEVIVSAANWNLASRISMSRWCWYAFCWEARLALASLPSPLLARPCHDQRQWAAAGAWPVTSLEGQDLAELGGGSLAMSVTSSTLNCLLSET
jgi:hypothetical protein